MDSSDTAEVIDSAVNRLASTPAIAINDEGVSESEHQADEHTPLVGNYTPRELMESCSLSNRSWRNTSSYIARISYYSRLNANNNGTFNVPPHVTAQYLVIPTATGYKQGGKQSSIVTIFAIWNTMMGTSMLSMSWGLQQAGFLLGLMLIISLGFITFYTANRVLRSQYHVPRNVVVFEFPDICRVFLGRWGEILAGIFGLLSFFGALLAYWTLMSTFLFNIGEFIHLQVRTIMRLMVRSVSNALLFRLAQTRQSFR